MVKMHLDLHKTIYKYDNYCEDDNVLLHAWAKC